MKKNCKKSAVLPRIMTHSLPMLVTKPAIVCLFIERHEAILQLQKFATHTNMPRRQVCRHKLQALALQSVLGTSEYP